MRYFALFTIIFVLFGAVAVGAQDGKVNFAGEWVLDADKSDQGGGGRGGGRGGRGRGMGGPSLKMNIEQKDDTLSVETFRRNRDGDEIATVNVYTLDGKKSKSETNFGTTESDAKWSKDGKVLTINSVMNMSRGDRDFTIESTAKWSLDKDVLTIETTRFVMGGERTSKAVYNKKKK